MCFKTNEEGEIIDFFDIFIDHLVSKNHHILTWRESVKYGYWVELALEALFDIEVEFESSMDEDKMKSKSWFFKMKSAPFGNIYILEKEIVYMEREELLENISYFNLVEQNKKNGLPPPQERTWKSLEHKGVILPLPYQKHNVPLIYDKKLLRISNIN